LRKYAFDGRHNHICAVKAGGDNGDEKVFGHFRRLLGWFSNDFEKGFTKPAQTGCKVLADQLFQFGVGRMDDKEGERVSASDEARVGVGVQIWLGRASFSPS
jgi:hypothetical protein